MNAANYLEGVVFISNFFSYIQNRFQPLSVWTIITNQQTVPYATSLNLLLVNKLLICACDLSYSNFLGIWYNIMNPLV